MQDANLGSERQAIIACKLHEGKASENTSTQDQQGDGPAGVVILLHVYGRSKSVFAANITIVTNASGSRQPKDL